MESLRFGPAGVPISCKSSSTIDGLECTKKLGLDAFEMEFVRGVKMKEELAVQVGKKARELDIVLSSHAPYYINLATQDKKKLANSRRHIIEAAFVTELAGGRITAVHPGFYQTLTKEKAYENVKSALREIGEELKKRKIKNAKVGLETMGKQAQFGTLEECIKLAQTFDFVSVVVDFSHMHARRSFDFRKESEYLKCFGILEKGLGDYVKNFHAHFQEIEYGEKGEKHHNPLGTRYEPDYRVFLKVCVENGYAGVVVSESPLIEKDAIVMKHYYDKLRKK